MRDEDQRIVPTRIRNDPMSEPVNVCYSSTRLSVIRHNTRYPAHAYISLNWNDNICFVHSVASLPVCRQHILYTPIATGFVQPWGNLSSVISPVKLNSLIASSRKCGMPSCPCPCPACFPSVTSATAGSLISASTSVDSALAPGSFNSRPMIFRMVSRMSAVAGSSACSRNHGLLM